MLDVRTAGADRVSCKDSRCRSGEAAMTTFEAARTTCEAAGTAGVYSVRLHGQHSLSLGIMKAHAERCKRNC